MGRTSIGSIFVWHAISQFVEAKRCNRHASTRNCFVSSEALKMSAESFDLYRVYGGRLSNNVTAFTDERSGSTCFRYSQSKGTTIGTVFMFEPMSPLFNYFELEIIKEGRKRTIGVGVAGSTYNATSQPGWGENSIGYNACLLYTSDAADE